MTTIIKGLPFNDDGRLKVSTDTVTARVGGLGIVEADDSVGYIALGGSAVPGTAVSAGGFLCDTNGKIYTTTDVAATDVYYNGHRFRNDGALVVEEATPSTGDVFVGGWAHEGDNSAAAIELAGPDVTAPTLVSASIPAAGTSVSIVLSESVTFGAGGNGGFTIAMSGGAVTLSYSSGSGTSTLVYTTSRTIGAGETCSDFDYTQPGNGVEDAAGNDLATFSNQQALVTNNSTADVTAPTLTSASIPSAGTSLSIVFSEAVSIGAGGNGGFAITMSGGAVTLTYSSGSGTNTLVYTTSRTISNGETCSDFDYTQPGNGVEDAAGNDLATFTNQQASVTNNSSQGGDVTAPTLSSLSTPTDGGSVSFVFSEAVSIGAGGNGGFTITLSGGACTLTYASGAGSNTLVYTASRTIYAGETASNYAYVQPGNGVEDAAGNDLGGFSGSGAYTNNSTASSFTPDSIPGLLGWWRKGVGLTTSGSDVTLWEDQKGSYDLANYLGAIGRAPDLQGDNTILFDGSDDCLTTSSFTAVTQPFALVIRYKAVTYGDGNGAVMGDFDGHATLSLYGTTPQLQMWGGTNLVNTNTNHAVNTYGNDFAVFNGTSSSLKVDATSAVASGTTPGSNSIDRLSIGFAGNQASNIQVVEAMFYGGGSWAGSFSSQDYTDLNAWLNAL